MLGIYRQACRVPREGRFSDAGRVRQVGALDDEVFDWCLPLWAADLAPLAEGPENDYRLLVNEWLRLLLAQQLFTFVTAPPTTQPNQETKPVAGTNNEAERTLRGAAQARVTGRTNKTLAGARRQTIVSSVLDSLRLYLPVFTLSSVLAEMQRWLEVGRSCFAEGLQKLHIPAASSSVLDQVFPHPSG